MAGRVYKVNFQHPTFGFPCRAYFCAGRVWVEIYGCDPDRTSDIPQGMSKEEFAKDVDDAWESVKEVSKRYRSLDDAGDALEAWGVDMYSEGGWEEDR